MAGRRGSGSISSRMRCSVSGVAPGDGWYLCRAAGYENSNNGAGQITQGTCSILCMPFTGDESQIGCPLKVWGKKAGCSSPSSASGLVSKGTVGTEVHSQNA